MRLLICFYIHSLVLQNIIGKEKKQNEKKKNNDTVLCWEMIIISSKPTLSGRPLSIARRRTLQLASREIYDVK